MNHERYVRCTTIRKEFDVSYKQLLEWSTLYSIRHVKTPGGKRMYHYGDIYTLFHKKPEQVQKKKIIYCSVSSSHQKEDLGRQIAFMESKYPGIMVIQDVGSGINFKPPGLSRLLKDVLDSKVETIIVSDRDRLCRFGFELVERLCDQRGTKILVRYHDKGERSDQLELSEGLLAVCNFLAQKEMVKKQLEIKKQPSI
eukprot:NODE_51_length_27121_cov_0.309452.p10 type:complete len:198 gc:universal NODE_51_length_27121_cov_0.309452:5953-6546(+)